MTIAPATAGNVTQKPDPELLRKFEAEKKKADEQIRRGEAAIKEAESMRKRAAKTREDAAKNADAKLRALGLIQ